MLGFLLTWNACVQERGRMIQIETHHILHRIHYLQSLRGHLRWGQCHEGCPPDPCVQPERVRRWGRFECSWRDTQVEQTDKIQTDTVIDESHRGEDRLCTCCPKSFFIASLSSAVLIWPSPFVSNWGWEKKWQINKTELSPFFFFTHFF